MHEVVGLGDGTMAGGLRGHRAPQLTWGHRKVFARLDRDGRRAARRPLAAQARRGGDALPRRRRGARWPSPGQHMIETLPRAARRAARLPRRDAQRRARRAAPHRLRRQAAGRPLRRGPRADRRGDRRAHPRGAAVDVGASPSRRTGTSYTTCFGFTLEELGEAGARVDRAEAAGDRPARRRRSRASRCRWTCRRASAPCAGRSCCAPASSAPATAGVHADPEAIAILFDQMRPPGRRARRRRPARRSPWDFTDAEPWHLTCSTATRATRGAGAAPARRPDAALDAGRLRRRVRRARRRAPADAAPPAAPARQRAAAAGPAEGARVALRPAAGSAPGAAGPGPRAAPTAGWPFPARG